MRFSGFKLLVCAALVPFVFGQTELPPIPTDLTTPVQQRLAFNGPTSMRIGWNTFQQLEEPTVYFGQAPNAMFRSASSQSSTTYPTSRTWSNTVTLTELEPYTTYCMSLAAMDERSEPNVPFAGFRLQDRVDQLHHRVLQDRARRWRPHSFRQCVVSFFFFLCKCTQSASANLLINHRQWLAVRPATVLSFAYHDR